MGFKDNTKVYFIITTTLKADLNYILFKNEMELKMTDRDLYDVLIILILVLTGA